MNYSNMRPIISLVAVATVVLMTTIVFAPTSSFAQSASTPDTVFLQMSKIVSPAHFSGTLLASDFSFTIVGNGVNETINHGDTIELAVGTYAITEAYDGSDPVGFNPADWTALWAGDICVNENIPATEAGTLTVLVSDVGKYVENNPGRCNAENQFKPGSVSVTKVITGTTTVPYETFSFSINGGDAVAFESDGSNDIDIPAGSYDIVEAAVSGYTTTYSSGCSGTVANDENVSCTITNVYDDGTGGGPDTGVLEVVKIVINDNNGVATATDFSFSVNGETPILFEAGGTNALIVPEGTYSIEENVVSGYTASYDNCTDVVVTVGATSTCTITNNDDAGGGGTSDPDTYRIEGYVWHDDNENTQWDGFNDDVMLEEEQSGWAVEITNGEVTYATTTDASGYYYFEVPAGTWTITEVLQEGWALITPVTGSFEVTVPGSVTVTMMDTLFGFLIPTAHAAVLGTYGPFNFGNNESVTTTTSGGGGGGSHSPQCTLFEAARVDGDTVLTWKTRYGSDLFITSGGTTIYTTGDTSKVKEGSFIAPDGQNNFELLVTRGSREDTCGAALSQPTPRVLGEQVDIIPQGAPNAGAGGAFPLRTVFGSVAPVALFGRKQIQNV